MGLVKQIEVDSVLSENDFNSAYIQVESVNRSGNSITSKIKIDVNTPDGVKRKTITANARKNDLFELSGRNDRYDGLKIYEIDFGSQQIELTKGVILGVGQSQGGMNDEVMKFMIRKTVEEHLKKEKQFRSKGIKVLSLFFIDNVKNYREYDVNGNIVPGRFAKWFEEISGDSNKLQFGNGIGKEPKTDLKKLGPCRPVPPPNNVKLFFIYQEADKSLMEKLKGYFLNGYKYHPNMQDFIHQTFSFDESLDICFTILIQQ